VVTWLTHVVMGRLETAQSHVQVVFQLLRDITLQMMEQLGVWLWVQIHLSNLLKNVLLGVTPLEELLSALSLLPELTSPLQVLRLFQIAVLGLIQVKVLPLA
jgi:hypothetical protein